MKTTKLNRLIAFILALSFLICGATMATGAESSEDGKNSTVSDKVISDYDDLLNSLSYREYSETGAFKNAPRPKDSIVIDALTYNTESSTGVRKDEEFGGLYTEAQSEVFWTVNIPTTGKYAIKMEVYSVYTGKATSIERGFYINDAIPFTEARALSISKHWNVSYVVGRVVLEKGMNSSSIIAELEAAGMKGTLSEDQKYISCEIPKVWTAAATALVDKYDIRFFNTDRNGDEYRSSAEQTPCWSTYYFKDGSGHYSNYFEFVFNEGENTISLRGVNEPMIIKSITLYALEDHIPYSEYIAKYEGIGAGNDVIKLEAEFAGATSTSSIYAVEDRTSAITSPSNTSHTLLNTIGGEKWATAGQWVEYSFTVGSSGMYDIVSRIRQNVLDGMYVCRELYVYSDGAEEGSLGYYDGIPFEECTRLKYNYNSKWQVTSLNAGDDVDYQLYFEAGVTYTLRLEVTLGSMGDIVVKVNNILDTINDNYLKIIKLTGTTPDSYRDYGFARTMPEVLRSFDACSKELYAISNQLKESAGSSSSNAATLDKVAALLYEMGHNPKKIASNLATLKSYIGTIGTFLSDAQTQPLEIDYILIQGAGGSTPKANANFFQSIWHEICNFFMSFFRNYDSSESDTTEATGDVAEVWIATARDQYNVMRNLVTNNYLALEENKNNTVNLKLVVATTLLPSILAGMGPDAYLGLAQGEVINYAIRGALLPIEGMEGFDETIKSFNESAMITMQMEDAEGVLHTYGLPDSQTFPMMFLRLDILQDLNVDIPKTWGDIYSAITVLQANNMQIGYTIDYKIFLYQMGGELFADNGMRINLDSKLGLESFEKTCDFFTQYSFPYTYDAANRFRTGEMPIIIADYVSLYNTLKVFATEIDGLWTFATLPGMENEEGDINNCSISTVTGSVIVSGSKHPESGWKFIQWYTGAQTQSDFANEMVAILGDSAKQASANRDALALMTWSADELVEVQKQFDNLAAVPNYPGSYYIDRYTKFAFLDAYNNDANPVTSLQSYIAAINNEITRKRKEFGLETLELNETLASKRIVQAQEELEALDTSAYTDIVNRAESALARGNEILIRESVTELQEANATFFAKVIGYMNDAADALATY